MISDRKKSTKFASLLRLLRGEVRESDSAQFHSVGGKLSDMQWVRHLVFAQVCPFYSRTRQRLSIYSLCVYINRSDIPISEIPLMAGGTRLKTRFLFRRGIRIPKTRLYLNVYSASLLISVFLLRDFAHALRVVENALAYPQRFRSYLKKLILGEEFYALFK